MKENEVSNQIEDEAMRAVGLEDGDIPRRELFDAFEASKHGLPMEVPPDPYEQMPKSKSKAESLTEATAPVSRIMKIMVRAQMLFIRGQHAFMHNHNLEELTAVQHDFMMEQISCLAMSDKGVLAGVQEQVINMLNTALETQGLI